MNELQGHLLLIGLGLVVAVAAPEDLAAAGRHHAAAPPVMLAAVFEAALLPERPQRRVAQILVTLSHRGARCSLL